MQLHVHSQIAHIAKTVRDGKWRAPDSLGYQEHVSAVGSIVAAHFEEALTRRFGVTWAQRADGRGFEIAGIGAEVLRAFSSRRAEIDAVTRQLAAEFTRRYGRKPSQRELGDLAQTANLNTRAAKGEGVIDWDTLREGWADKLARTLGISLASVAPSVCGAGGAAGVNRAGGPGPSPRELERAARKALALAHQEKSAFTRADLVKHLGRELPRTGTEPAEAVRLVEALADRVLRSEFEQVVCLDAPEAVETPAALLRADGRSVYQRHGGTRYATRVQLSMEERLIAQAQTEATPGLARETAARLLGASTAQLAAALAGRAQDAHAEAAPAGLRIDQAAAAFAALSGGRLATVINAPAGSGKTRVLTAIGRAWAAGGMGRVVGVTPSQSSRNTLAAGVAESYNFAQFLGHLPGRRGARGAVPLRPGDLLLIDEASMLSTQDMADTVSHASATGAKVVLAGDTRQLQAVENGGGMSLLASRLGYLQLAEPVRFSARWEQAASLRLRAGDASVLAEYDQHGRIRGAEPELAMDQAAKAYVALTLDGTDVLLTVQDHARRRELSRRIRDDLRHLAVVSRGTSVQIADGQQASAGDLIVCTENDHRVQAGEPGRTLANGDLLRIEEITRNGIIVRRAVGADPQTGQRRWTMTAFPYEGYGSCELGYAVTVHAAQSRTVHTGLAVITGSEDRQHAYVALSRGTANNTAYVFTITPRLADPRPGPRPAPELGRYERITRERDGHLTQEAGPGPAEREAVAVLADVVERDGEQLSATETQQRNLADADHLGIWNAVWAPLTQEAHDDRYRDLVTRHLPPGYQGQELSHQAKWLYRTLRAAELAGLDPEKVTRTAIESRDLSGARDVASVIDARIRQRVHLLAPQPQGLWSQRVPQAADPTIQHYLTDVAALMDERKERIGEFAAGHSPGWAVRALGPVPDDPLDRLDWEKKASSIGAYREMHGYDHPADPIGPEPAGDTPDKRAAWHEAFTALRPADGPDVRDLPDGSLWLMRDTYAAETQWAPKHVGRELRLVRTGAQDAGLGRIRAIAEASAARNQDDHVRAASHDALAASYQAMSRRYREQETTFAKTMEDRREWETATEHSRHFAVAADAELRRRRPGQRIEPLRTAEPAPASDTQHEELLLAAGKEIGKMSQWIQDLAAQPQAFREQLEQRKGLMIPHEDPDRENLGEAFPSWTAPDKEAILQPPKPEIRPAAKVLELAAERDPDREMSAP